MSSARGSNKLSTAVPSQEEQQATCDTRDQLHLKQRWLLPAQPCPTSCACNSLFGRLPSLPHAHAYDRDFLILSFSHMHDRATPIASKPGRADRDPRSRRSISRTRAKATIGKQTSTY